MDITSSVIFKTVLGRILVLLISYGLKTGNNCQQVKAMLDSLDHITSTGSKSIKVLERDTRKIQRNSKVTSSFKKGKLSLC